MSNELRKLLEYSLDKLKIFMKKGIELFHMEVKDLNNRVAGLSSRIMKVKI